MNTYFFRFASPYFLLLLLLVPLIMWLRTKKRATYYLYPCTQLLVTEGMTNGHLYKKIVNALRLLSIILLIIIAARPQRVDEQSKVEVQGIDIMLVLDVSGSMSYQDYTDDARSRFDVAKEEACRFISKRLNDALGLVIFANAAVSRCPLTMDKKMLLDFVKSIQLGEIDHTGTLLATSMVTAVNRLKNSKAASKVMIVLTDGEPSEGDIEPTCAIEIAKKFGIKIYAIGIGSDQPRMAYHPLYGVINLPAVNKKLLDTIADHTGGRCFIARNAQDMREVYDTIDQLEKTKQEMPLFTQQYDLYVPIALLILCMLMLELFVATCFWLCL